jgi:hypothetical protein
MRALFKIHDGFFFIFIAAITMQYVQYSTYWTVYKISVVFLFYDMEREIPQDFLTVPGAEKNG